jgi:predicted HAD superfamily phosphohydrolase YqeG
MKTLDELLADKILDFLFDDIYGGKRNNMKTALVKEVEER